MLTETPSSLHHDALRLHSQATAQHNEALALVPMLTPEQWRWSPNAHTWNIALILEHLNIISNLMLPKMEKVIEKLRSEKQFGVGPFHYSWPEQFFMRILSPNPPFKVPVPTLYVPRIHADPVTEVGPSFLKNQQCFLRRLEAANGLDWKRIKIPSSAFGWMHLTLGCWLEVTVSHEQYHWLQVESLLAHPNFPKSGGPRGPVPENNRHEN